MAKDVKVNEGATSAASVSASVGTAEAVGTIPGGIQAVTTTSLQPQPQQLPQQSAKQTPADDDMVTVRAGDIRALKEKAANLEAENRTLAETNGSSVGNFERSLQTTATKPTWLFRVKVANDPSLPTVEIKAVDESEAIRLYALKHAKGNKPLDTVKCRFQVDCLQAAERRQFGIVARNQRLADKGYPTAPAISVGG